MRLKYKCGKSLFHLNRSSRTDGDFLSSIRFPSRVLFQHTFSMQLCASHMRRHLLRRQSCMCVHSWSYVCCLVVELVLELTDSRHRKPDEESGPALPRLPAVATCPFTPSGDIGMSIKLDERTFLQAPPPRPPPCSALAKNFCDTNTEFY